MSRSTRDYTIFTPLRHPLVLAALAYVLIVCTGWSGAIRLWLLDPVALAKSEAEQAPDKELTGEERTARELVRLRDENAQLAQSYELMRQTHKQLNDFKEAFGPVTTDKAIPAEIILRGDSSNWRHSVYINRGSRHGVKEGYPVTIGRTLAGRVIACSPDTSLVQLVTDPAFTAAVSIVPNAPLDANARPQSSRGLLKGNGSAAPRMPALSLTDVALDADVKPGMLVMTNDAAAQLPAGLLVGSVRAVHHRSTFLEVEVESALDLPLTDMLLVIPHQRPTLNDAARRLAETFNGKGMERRHLDKG